MMFGYRKHTSGTNLLEYSYELRSREQFTLPIIEDVEEAKKPNYVKMRESIRPRGGKGRHRNKFQEYKDE